MILKLILFAIIGIFLYKLLGGQLPTIGRGKGTPKKSTPEGDTMVECNKCGTFVSVEEATLRGGKYYCDECK